MDGCRKQRQRTHGGQGRWCCDHQLAVRRRHRVKAVIYRNRFGDHVIDRALGEELLQAGGLAHTVRANNYGIA